MGKKSVKSRSVPARLKNQTTEASSAPTAFVSHSKVLFTILSALFALLAIYFYSSETRREDDSLTRLLENRSLDTIDRRSDLSLEEYTSLYDGKW